MELFYQIEEKSFKEGFLPIKIFSKGEANRVLYRDVLFSFLKEKDRKAVDFIIEKHCQFLRISSKSVEASKVSFSLVHIPKDESEKAIKLLGATGQLFWKGKKLIVDPFSLIKVSYEVEEKEEESLFVKPILSVLEKQISFQETDFFFGGAHPWMIHEGIWRGFDSSCELSWLSKVSLHGVLLERRMAKRLIEDLQLEKEGSLIWKKPSKEVEVFPCLILEDRFGAFANLWMEYGDRARLSFHDKSFYSFRDVKKEEAWEKDLLEAGYQKKIVDRSHYFCPTDKISQTLQFLIEIGWKVLDQQGRRVCLPGGKELSLLLEEDVLYLTGNLRFGEISMDVAQVVSAIGRKERFLEIGQGSVALVDTKEFTEEFSPLAKEREAGEKIMFTKDKFALLEPYFSQNQEKPLFLTQWQNLFEEEALLPSFHGSLFPYQKEGVQWLQFMQKNGFHGLLADEMGLGKTVQLIAFFSLFQDLRPTLIVMPTSLLFHWKKEIEKFLPGKEVYLHAENSRCKTKEELAGKEFILTSYALLRIDQELFSSISFQFVVLDEAQFIKNPDSQAAKAAYCLRAQMRIAVTGTPIENQWQDLWSIFAFIQPSLLGSRKEFLSSISSGDLLYQRRIKAKIKPFWKRRTKDAVDIQLPPKIEQTIWVEMTNEQQDLYRKYLSSTKKSLQKQVEKEGIAACRMQILEAILRLRQICCHPHLVDSSLEGDGVQISAKYDRLLADLEEVYEKGHKAIVFSQFTKMLSQIRKQVEEKGWKYTYLDGSTKDRGEAVEKFQEDPETKIFLLSLKAGGVGLTLTAAEYVFFYDPWWNEAVEAQAIDRVHRVGQQNKVIIRRYLTANSIEEKMLQIKERKKVIITALFEENADMDTPTLEEWYALFQSEDL